MHRGSLHEVCTCKNSMRAFVVTSIFYNIFNFTRIWTWATHEIDLPWVFYFGIRMTKWSGYLNLHNTFIIAVFTVKIFWVRESFRCKRSNVLFPWDSFRLSCLELFLISVSVSWQNVANNIAFEWELLFKSVWKWSVAVRNVFKM